MIKIAHLYYDLMNLYGENANVRALKKHLEQQNVAVEVNYLTKGDEIDFNLYDIFYMGMGTEQNQLIVLNDIFKYQNTIKKIIKDKTFIMTGNSIELFGNYILTKKGKIKALDVFNYYCEITNERITFDGFFATKLIDNPVIGSHNRYGMMYSTENEFFRVIEGKGSNNNSHLEGYQIQDFYGTYMIGPLLIRNPYLTEYIIKRLLEKKDLPYQEKKDLLTYKAYEEYLKNFTKKDK